jgi:predicted Zn-ribbon and HTH transcriptional regulator
VTSRRQLREWLGDQPRSASWLARELGLTRGDVEDDLRHLVRSARAAGDHVDVIPARCKSCDFVFSEDKLSRPSRCPACKGTRLHEPQLRIRPA